MDKDEDRIDLQKRIALVLSEKEQLEEENRMMKEQIERFRILYVSTVEFATSVENELQNKLESLTHGSKNFKTRQNLTLKDLRERLSLQIDINEDLQKKIRTLQEELEKLHLIFFNTVEHSTFLENSLDEKVGEFSKLAETDNLTGIFNRLKFYQSIDEEMEKLKSKRNNLSVIMFDIDNFKKVNDIYGHDSGDSVLVHITQISNKYIRKRDTFSRWGGEEFMILLPETGLSEAIVIAERLRVSIAEFIFEQAGHITCSFGVAHYRYPEDSKSFLKRVDEALYKAKEEGKNRVVDLENSFIP